MNNTDNTPTNNPIDPTLTPAKDTPNKKFFTDLLTAYLPEDKIKQILGDLDGKKWNNDTIEPVKTTKDQEKINAYDNLKVKDLPSDWENQLARLKYLEGQLSNYTQIQEELKGWTDTFTNQQPVQVQEEITNLEESKKQTEETLNAKIKELEESLDRSIKESQKIALVSIEKIQALETELEEWKGTWNGQELKEVKVEWDLLNKRPDLAITEQEWWDDYARRQPLAISNLEKQELEKAKEKVKVVQEEKKEILQTINQYLANECTKRFVLVDSVSTPEQAETKIIKLLEGTREKWTNYLTPSDNIADQELKLILTLTDQEKKSRAYQIIAWIEEAQSTQDYQTLFERWSGATIYNKEYDYDAGSLYLLGKYLEIKNTP